MNIDKLQDAIERANNLSDGSLTIATTLIEIAMADERGLRDQAEVDYWTDRLNDLCDAH